jgi:hypothetical protein
MRLPMILLSSAGLCAATVATAGEFEAPPDEPPAASLPADQAAGPDFRVVDPVRSDGLMRHYVIDSRFGTFPAYGRASLSIRLREVAALARIAATTDVDVITKAVAQHVRADVQAVAGVAAHPVRTVVGIPQGIGHLFKGYAAQARELTARSAQDGGEASKTTAGQRVQADAARYADRYLGISAADRRWSRELGVDPYTDNEVLRKAVHHLAKVDVAANLGMKFASLPGLPYAGELRRAMDAIYEEDPAVLRASRRATLAGYGLERAEIESFENALLLSPTRQQLLEEAAKALDGVDGRAELFRHALSLTSDEEVQVFLRSTGLLVRLHGQRPLARIVPGLRLPAAQLVDGRIALCGAFDSVYWTADVAGYEQALRAVLPADAPAREVWLAGAISPRARSEFAARGWDVHEDALETLGERPAS